jgi:hypothetical protein
VYPTTGKIFFHIVKHTIYNFLVTRIGLTVQVVDFAKKKFEGSERHKVLKYSIIAFHSIPQRLKTSSIVYYKAKKSSLLSHYGGKHLPLYPTTGNNLFYCIP